MTHAPIDDVAQSQQTESRLYARVTRRLIPFLFLCYVAAYLDRVNVGFAKLRMLADLGFSETTYGLGAGIFFIGYFAFEVPSNILLHRLGARVWIARVMLTWAAISAGMMFVHSPMTFYLLRFLLGLAEAGLFPGVILYLTYWFPAARRARMVALFMTGVPVASIVGGPLSGWILQSMSGVRGLASWQWLFILESIPSFVLGIATLFYLDDGIAGARWLTDDEKAFLARRVAEDRVGAAGHRLRDGLTNPRVWLLSLVYFLLVAGLYGSGFWLPTLIGRTGVASPLAIGALTAVPNIVAAVVMVLVGRRSDAVRERRWHIIIPGLIGAIGWVVTVRSGVDTAFAVLGMSIAVSGVMTTIALFWSLPTSILAGDAAATGIALINSIGNLAGFLGPSIIGWIIDRQHTPDLGIYGLAGCMALGSLLVLTMPARLVNR